MICTCDHSAKSFLFRIEAKEFFLQDNEIEWTTGASSGLSYFDQIVLRRGEKTATPPPCAAVYIYAMRNTQFAADVGCHHSHLSRSLLFHWTEKDDANEKGFTQTKNRNKQEWEREREKKDDEENGEIYQTSPKLTDYISTMGSSNPFGFDIN